MNALSQPPRTPVPLAGVLFGVLAGVLTLTGCPGDSPGDGEDEGTDEGTNEPQVCIDPGTPLLDSAEPVEVPGPDAAPFTCTVGWGTDTPQLDPTWTIELPAINSEYGFNGITVVAHPEGGAVVGGSRLFARYDDAGDQLWSLVGVVPEDPNLSLVVESDGAIVLAFYNWGNDTGYAARYSPAGDLIGNVAIPWNNPGTGEIWGLATRGDELLIGAVDLDGMGSWETTLLRLDADDNLLLRKSTNITSSGQLAANDAGTLLFGNFPAYFLAADNGAVLGTLTPSTGTAVEVVGFGEDFVAAGVGVGVTTFGDFSIARYSSTGTERWVQTYDRASNSDNARAIAVGPDQSIVAVGGTSLLFASSSYWFGTQPVVFAADEDGNAIWTDRIAAQGEATSVSIGPDGAVYVGGIAQAVGETNGIPDRVSWLRRYAP